MSADNHPIGAASRVPPGERGVRLGDHPLLSVVALMGPNGASPTRVAALASACCSTGTELVVVGSPTHDARTAIIRNCPETRFVAAPAGATERSMRRLGLTNTEGDIVAMFDARRERDDGWLETLAASTGRGEDRGRNTDRAATVIVPAHQCDAVLPRVLGALIDSSLARTEWELVVVDDASTDQTELVAAEYADTVVRLSGNAYGPGYARNRGAEASRGDLLVFVDSDVVVHPDALARFASLFASNAEASAAFGSYDDAPESPGLVSRFRNLLHHFIHHANAGPAETFWAGLGAVRRAAFFEISGFNEWHFSRPQIEDIELGRRLRHRGRDIVLDPGIQGQHLKHWTLKGMLETDFKNRGVPWMGLLLREGPSAGSGTLNLRFTQRLCTALIGILGVALATTLLAGPWALSVAAAAAVAIGAMNLGFYRFLQRRHGVWFAAACLPLHFGYFAIGLVSSVSGWIVHTVLGEPVPPPERQVMVGVKTWPPQLRRTETGWTDSSKKADRGVEGPRGMQSGAGR